MGAEWTGRVEMAPFAEALGITTDSVMGVGRGPNGRSWVVLFTETPTADPDELIWIAVLRPDPAGILQVVRRSPHKTVGEMNADLAEHMERTFGPPEGRDDGAV